VDEVTTLVEALLKPDAYPHPVTKIELLETHISWVILTGPFAYKIKKPIKLDFLDFSSLEKRRHFCDEELILNACWAPHLYLEVVPIRKEAGRMTLGSSGAVIDYAVKMKQFSQSGLLDAQLAAGQLKLQDMTAIAKMLSVQHEKGQVYRSTSVDQPLAYIENPMLENFKHFRSLNESEDVRQLQVWTKDNLERMTVVMTDREARGFIRECHGDLHLGNLVRFESEIVAFDCVEFNADLRNIDVMSDVAFLVMDLIARDRTDLAFQFLNDYLELSGDYEGLRLLDLYFVYHCMIRAKVAAIRSSERSNATDSERDLAVSKHYVSVALEWTKRPLPALIVMHGFSASGKSWLSGNLMNALPAIRLRSDVERKRLFNVGRTECSHSEVGGGIYKADRSIRVYESLRRCAKVVLTALSNVIIDASFLSTTERKKVEDVADRMGLPFWIIDVCADEATLNNRLALRAKDNGVVSEADMRVLRRQLETADPLSPAELIRTIQVSTDAPIDVSSLVAQIQSQQCAATAVAAGNR